MTDSSSTVLLWTMPTIQLLPLCVLLHATFETTFSTFNSTAPITTDDPETTPDFQTTATVDNTPSIQCGETRSGTIGDFPQSMLLNFTNPETQDVMFTDCGTEFDANLSLSINGNHVRCGENVCDFSLRTFYTMIRLPAGSYKLKLTPHSAGGSWTLTVTCFNQSDYATEFATGTINHC